MHPRYRSQPIAKMTNDDDEGASLYTAPTRLWALLSLCFAIPVFVVLALNDHQEKGLFAASATFVLIGILRGYWKLRGRTWFQVTFLALVVLHALITAVIHFNIPKYSILATAPLVVIDFFGVYWLIACLEKRFAVSDRRPGSGRRSP